MSREVFVLDTNSLLYKADIIYDFPGAEILIPQTVLSELDRLKISHFDKDIKFRIRRVSRLLYEVALKGNLAKGISLGNGSTLQVVLFDPSKPYPQTLNVKSSDDQILAIVSQFQKANPKDSVTVVTNDLNMLLKAQMLDLNVIRFEEEKKSFDLSFKKLQNFRLIVNWTGALILIIILGYIAWQITCSMNASNELPPGIQAEVETYRIQEQEFQKILLENPKDKEALIGLGNLYFDTQRYQLAIDTYRKVLKVDPANTDVRTDMAIAYYRIGLKDVAVNELKQVLDNNPNHAYAYYNLGVIYWKGFADANNSLDSLKKCLELEPDTNLSLRANQLIAEINKAVKENVKKQDV